MSRRRKTGLAERFALALIKLPPWVSLLLGAVSYAALETYQRTQIAPRSAMSFSIVTSAYPAIALAFFGSLGLLSAMHRQRRGRLVDEQRGLASLRAMPWKDFEYLVAEAFHRQGFAVDYSLESGPDGGTDIVLKKAGRKALVQCKRWRSYQVGVNVAREMYGLLHAEGAEEVMVVTTHSFTAEAAAFAKGKPIRLIDGPALWQMVQDVQADSSPTSAPPPLPELPKTTHAVAMTSTTNAPACPACGTAMVKRVSKRGATEGTVFWGCPTYPACRGSRSIG